MVTSAYRLWKARGGKFALAEPIEELQAWAKQHGVKVLGTIGNHEHLTADRPEDHTPFSSTAWPNALPGYVVCAIDLKNVERDGVTLGRAIERQARAGKLPWLKYVNHGGRHLDSRTGWQATSSGDDHVHLSIRTDWIDRNIGEFNPWRVEPGSEDFDMATVNDVWGTDGLVAAPPDREDKKNTHWTPAAALAEACAASRRAARNSQDAEALAQRAADGVAEVRKTLDELKQAVASLVVAQASGGGAAKSSGAGK